MVALLGAAALGAVNPRSAETRALYCDALADYPVVYLPAREGFATGGVDITPCSSFWSYTLKFSNRAGNALNTNTGTAYGQAFFGGSPQVSCAGAYVHSFIYINVSGVGKSDTGPEVSDCAY